MNDSIKTQIIKDAPVQVCPICDIEGCQHIREAASSSVPYGYYDKELEDALFHKAGALADNQPVSQVQPGAPVTLSYTNWSGVTSQRTIIPRHIWWGSTEWHPEPQWLLTAFDVDKQAERHFALKDFGQPMEVKVKPLVWSGDKYLCAQPEPYQIWPDNGGSGAPDDPLIVYDGFMLYNPYMRVIGLFPTIADAMQVAQEKHIQNICSQAVTIRTPATVQDAARVLLAADLSALIDGAMSDAVDETDEGTWIDEDRGACVGSAALMNAWTAALRAIAEGE